MNYELLHDIQDSLINGQNQQAIDFIIMYGIDFWTDYKTFLQEFYNYDGAFNWYTKTTIIYFKLKG